jgi:hypothetical protein
MKPIETKSLVLLQHHLKRLRLPTMHDECEKLATRCAQENVDHLAFLLQLCELELLDRERRSTQRRLRLARFPNHKTLDNFKFEAQPSLNRLLVAELMRCQYIEQRESVILIGNPGTGKPQPSQYPFSNPGMRGPSYRHGSDAPAVWPRFAVSRRRLPAGSCAALPGRGAPRPIRLCSGC